MLNNFAKKCFNKIMYKQIALLNIIRIKKSEKKIEKLRNIHNGKRCFIIGNGPSLSAEDLDKLKDEICFGTNRIYHIYDKTDWRPTYYCVQDYKLIMKSKKEICDIKGSVKLIAICDYLKNTTIRNANYMRIHLDDFYPEMPKFSDDMKLGIYEGMTVTYMCMQMAAYMGFEEIYLLGIDHSYSQTLMPDGSIQTNNDMQKDHFSNGDTTDNLPQIFKTTLAYQAAKKYAEEHGIKIYNATRGGKLEIFERIDLDELFK